MLEKRRFHFSEIGPWGKAFLACLAVCAVSAGLFWAAPDPALAQLNQSQNVVNTTAQAAGLGGTTTDLPTIIGRIIYVILSTVGVIFLALLLFSGYQYMTAGGDAEKIKKAVMRIRNAVIGLLIIAFSFVIVNFILGWLAGETNFWGISGGGGGGGFGQWENTGGLGNGEIIEYHYPEPGQTNVARNTAIVITFVNPVDPASFINGWKEGQPRTGELNSTLVRIHPEVPAGQTKVDLLPNQALVVLATSTDGLSRTVMIKPNDPLGNSQKPTWYEVKLENGILNASGTKVFTGDFGGGYVWRFQVSTQIDNTPPHVLSVMPISGGKYARNIVVQVNFDEPMFPMSVAGIYKGSGFTNLQVLQSDEGLNEAPVDGEFRLSNGYRTVEFVTTDFCGQNSCLVNMYCLPALKTIRGLVKAASIAAGQSPLAAGYKTGFFDGAVDMAFNSLDGDYDGKATGPPGDLAGGMDNFPPALPNFPSFSFYVKNEINRDPPYIKAVDPAVEQDQIPLDKNVDIAWYSDPGDMTGVLLGYTVTSKSFRIYAGGPQEDLPNTPKAENADTWWFFTKFKNVDDKGEEATSTSKHVQSLATIYHRPFVTSEIPKKDQKPADVNNWYDPYVRHYVMNIYQNCFNPASYIKAGKKTQAPAATPNFCNDEAVVGVDRGGGNYYCDFILVP